VITRLQRFTAFDRLSDGVCAMGIAFGLIGVQTTTTRSIKQFDTSIFLAV